MCRNVRIDRLRSHLRTGCLECAFSGKEIVPTVHLLSQRAAEAQLLDIVLQVVLATQPGFDQSAAESPDIAFLSERPPAHDAVDVGRMKAVQSLYLRKAVCASSGRPSWV